HNDQTAEVSRDLCPGSDWRRRRRSCAFFRADRRKRIQKDEEHCRQKTSGTREHFTPDSQDYKRTPISPLPSEFAAIVCLQQTRSDGHVVSLIRKLRGANFNEIAVCGRRERSRVEAWKRESRRWISFGGKSYQPS